MKILWQCCRWKRHCQPSKSIHVIHCEPIIDHVLFPVQENTFYVKVKDMMRIRRWETFLQCSSGTSGVRHKVFLFVGKNFLGEVNRSQSFFLICTFGKEYHSQTGLTSVRAIPHNWCRTLFWTIWSKIYQEVINYRIRVVYLV